MGLLLGLGLLALAIGVLAYGFGVATFSTWNVKELQDLSRKRRKQELLELQQEKKKVDVSEAIPELPKPKAYMGNATNLFENEVPFFISHADIVKRFGRFVPLYLGRTPVLLLSDPNAIREVWVEQFEHFPNRSSAVQLRESTGLVFARDGVWKRMRRTVSPMFSLARMKPMAEVINAKGKMLSDRLAHFLENASNPEHEVDIHDLLSRLTLDVIGETAFATRLDSLLSSAAPAGVPPSSSTASTVASRLLDAARMLLSNSAGRFKPRQMVFKLLPMKIRTALAVLLSPELATNLETIDNHTYKMVQQRREEHRRNGEPATPKDFLDLLLTAKDSDTGAKLTDRECTDQCNTFLIAGSDTTSNTLSYAIYLLAQHPKIEEALLQEINTHIADKVAANQISFDDLKNLPYLDAVVRETLRVFPPVATTVRECASDVVLPKSGLFIPKGAEVHVPIYAIHHDPYYWPEPQSFNPDRWLQKPSSSGAQESPSERAVELYGAGSAGSPGPWYAFGAGPRACIGMKFALMEAKMVLATIIYNYRFKLARAESQIPLKLQPGITISPAEGIWVHFERRSKPTVHYV